MGLEVGVTGSNMKGTCDGWCDAGLDVGRVLPAVDGVTNLTAVAEQKNILEPKKKIHSAQYDLEWA